MGEIKELMKVVEAPEEKASHRVGDDEIQALGAETAELAGDLPGVHCGVPELVQYEGSSSESGVSDGKGSVGSSEEQVGGDAPEGKSVTLGSDSVPPEPSSVDSSKDIVVIDLVSPEGSPMALDTGSIPAGAPSDTVPEAHAPEETPATGSNGNREGVDVDYKFSPEAADSIITSLGFFLETPHGGWECSFSELFFQARGVITSLWHDLVNFERG